MTWCKCFSATFVNSGGVAPAFYEVVTYIVFHTIRVNKFFDLVWADFQLKFDIKEI